MIRSTFAAVPTRLPVLAAKALTLVVLAAAVALVSVTLSYLVTMAQLSRYDLVPALDDPGTWRVLGGSVYCLTAAALFSLGLGTLLRSTAATVTVALTVRPAAAAGHPQLHHPGLGADHRQLPAAAGVLNFAHNRDDRRARCQPLHIHELGRGRRIRRGPDCGGRRGAAPPRRLTLSISRIPRS